MVDLNGRLGLHERFRSQVVHIGNEQSPVLIFDDFLDAPQVMVDYAAADAVFQPSDASYPGLRGAVPPIYSFALRTFLSALICKVFAFEHNEVIGGSCGFAITTTPPEQLQLVQRMPHFDSTNRKQVALLHYLCTTEKGGTSFYRHRRTGYEIVDETRAVGYTTAVRSELATFGAPTARYIGDDDAMFERIASFEAVFNRVLVYRSASLHSAAILPNFSFDPSPRTGRLTVNALFIYR